MGMKNGHMNIAFYSLLDGNEAGLIRQERFVVKPGARMEKQDGKKA